MKRRRSGKSFWIALILIAVLIVLLRLFVFHTVRIEGSSMEETLSGGDIALVARMFKEPKRGDIVECRFPDRSGTYVKRVAGLPGEQIELKGNILYADGAPVSEPYVSSAAQDYSIQLGEDEYLLLGDNRAQSYDSREADMGPIGREDFIGKVVLLLWPLKGL